MCFNEYKTCKKEEYIRSGVFSSKNNQLLYCDGDSYFLVHSADDHIIFLVAISQLRLDY
jgi:hypothetical protein